MKLDRQIKIVGVALTIVRIILLTAIALCIIHTVKADDVKLTDYRAGEVNIDAGYALSTETFGDYSGSSYMGANYFLTKGAGLHIGATAADEFHGTLVERVEFGLVGRVPINSFAIDFGIGSSFGLQRDDWEVYAEAGPRFRVTKYLDLFAKVRGSRPIAGAAGERVAVIAGAGVHF